MESLLDLIDVFCCVLEPLVVSGVLADIAAYFASAPNRKQRREAKEKGEPIPPRDVWTWIFAMLLGLTAGLGAIMIAKYAMLGRK